VLQRGVLGRPFQPVLAQRFRRGRSG
jgi:hypothetical protein